MLHVRSVSGSGGGPEKTILNSPRHLADHGYRVVCAYLHPPDDPGVDVLRNCAEELEASFLSIPDRGPLDIRSFRDLLQLCRRESVAIWHGHEYKSNALGLVLRQFHPMRLVTTVHGWVQHTCRTPVYHWIDRKSLRHYDRVLCVSEDLIQACQRSGVKAENCLLIKNAIDTARYRRSEETATAKRRLGFASNRTLIGAVGRLSEEKGFSCLIRAVNQLIQNGLDVELAIAGDGHERSTLKNEIARLNCAEKIHLLGHRSDLIDLYQAMDIFALSSLREGLPNVVLEAMAMEVPVVATRIAGMPSLINEGENGLLIEPADESGLAKALQELVDQPNLRRKLSQAGRKTIEAGYSFASRMEKIRAVYDELLSTESLGTRKQSPAPLPSSAPHVVEQS